MRLTAIAVAALVAFPMVARANGRVTYLEGKAFRTPAGSGEMPTALAEGSDVEVGDVLETNAASKLEITLADDSVIARCRLESIGTSSLRTFEEVVTRGGEVSASAEAVLVARDPETGRSRPLTDIERAALERSTL